MVERYVDKGLDKRACKDASKHGGKEGEPGEEGELTGK